MAECMECHKEGPTLVVCDPHIRVADIELCEPCLEKLFDFQQVRADDSRRQFARTFFAQQREAAVQA